MSRSQLAEPDRIRLEDTIRRFQENWSSDAMKSLPQSFDEYLPPDGDALRGVALQELISLDLSSRWRIGQKVRVEFYLSAFPELEREPDRLVAIIFEEYRTRTFMQEPIAVQAYQERFPEHFDRFYRHVRAQVGSVETAVSDTAKSNRPTTPSDSKSFVPEFSRYELVKRVGAGQFGEVWSAKAPGGVDVALKIIPWPSAHKMSQMELRALEVMKSLRHAFLVPVHAYWPMDDQVAIVMELADGSLEDRLKECRAEGQLGVPREELITYMNESAEAIDHLHEQNVLHRDIKPANILVVQGHAKVGDFGVARLVNQEPADLSATCVGTPQFMAPEVWENNVQPKSDQYSLAITYVELRIGRPVFVANSLGELLRSHTSATPELDPIPANEQAIILKALNKRPEDRFENCVEFIGALHQLVLDEQRAIASRGERLRRRIIISGILTVAAAAAILPFFILPRGEELEPQLDLPTSVSLKAGTTDTFSIDLISNDVTAVDPSQVFIDGLPDGISYDLTQDQTQLNKIVVKLTAGLLMATGTHPLNVKVALDEADYTGNVDLIIEPPEVAFLPPNASPAPHSTPVRADGKLFHSHLYVTLPTGESEVAGLPIEFILIPRTNTDDPASFYMMKNKVWNALFDNYHSANNDPPLDTSWTSIEFMELNEDGLPARGEYLATEFPNRPVYSVSVEEAHWFAVWIGGKLPTEKEWEKAAGRFNRTDAESGEFMEGPYRGTWDPAVGGIAVGDDFALPADVGTSEMDETIFGCRDMAGNGREMTCELVTNSNLRPQVPVAPETGVFSVVVKGRDLRKGSPLQYDQFGALPTFYFSNYWDRSTTTSFRVVLPVIIDE